MVFYDSAVEKEMKKGHVPKDILRLFINAFKALDQTKDLNLFDIKFLKTDDSINFYRLRKGKYRAIFRIDNDQDFHVMIISKREEVYKKWQ